MRGEQRGFFVLLLPPNERMDESSFNFLPLFSAYTAYMSLRQGPKLANITQIQGIRENRCATGLLRRVRVNTITVLRRGKRDYLHLPPKHLPVYFQDWMWRKKECTIGMEGQVYFDLYQPAYQSFNLNVSLVVFGSAITSIVSFEIALRFFYCTTVFLLFFHRMCRSSLAPKLANDRLSEWIKKKIICQLLALLIPW